NLVNASHYLEELDSLKTSLDMLLASLAICVI
ncbi:unnamed protein product, partial [marine sediment metagenome]